MELIGTECKEYSSEMFTFIVSLSEVVVKIEISGLHRFGVAR
jgi:hypothetical protein